MFRMNESNDTIELNDRHSSDMIRFDSLGDGTVKITVGAGYELVEVVMTTDQVEALRIFMANQEEKGR